MTIEPSIPSPTQLSAMLRNLLDRNVSVKPVAKPTTVSTPKAIAVYEGEVSHVRCVFAVDLPAAASIAAALSLVPPAVVDGAVKIGRLDPALVDNLKEIFNVGVRLFDGNGDRMKLLSVHLPGENVPTDTTQLMVSSKQRTDVEVSVAGYRAGIASAVRA
jgi:hypothetical protein